MLTFKDMKRFVGLIVLFFLLVFVADLLLGQVFSYLTANPKGGENKRNNYICNQVSEDILIYGSSRAEHHYNPLIITDSLDMSCYNCGQGGMGIILSYARYMMACQRYHPKAILVEVTPYLDLLEESDNSTSLKYLRAYYDKKGVPEIFESIDPTEKYKMHSKLYRYNSNFIQIIGDYIHPLSSDGINGFHPMIGELDTMKISIKPQPENYSFDSLKISYLNKMVDLSGDTKVVFVVSPIWYGMDSRQLSPIKEMAEKRNLTFIDLSNSPKYVHNNAYFKDGTHLNSQGANEFTRDLIEELKKQEVFKGL